MQSNMPTKRALYVAAFVALIAAVMVFAGALTPGRFSFLWRKAWHSPISPSRPYQAPLIPGCDLPGKAKDNYIVYLHLSTSLEEHKRTAALDESKIMDEIPEVRGFPSRYYIENIEDEVLRRIRADVAVDAVECAEEQFGNWAYPIWEVPDTTKPEPWLPNKIFT